MYKQSKKKQNKAKTKMKQEYIDWTGEMCENS